jgi:nickel-type superoxide dismutase maturation protease
VEVSGDSMRPTLAPGDWAIAVSLRSVRPGDVVVLRHPGRPALEIVKRVTAVTGGRARGGRSLGPGELWVEGDDRARSTDSRHFGPVGRDAVRGTIRLVYWPPGRWRVLRAGR